MHDQNAETDAVDATTFFFPLISTAPALAFIAASRTRCARGSHLAYASHYFCSLSTAPALALIAARRTRCARVYRLAYASFFALFLAATPLAFIAACPQLSAEAVALLMG